MKIHPSSLLFRSLGACAAAVLFSAGVVLAQDKDGTKPVPDFLGWIPMQPVTAGERLTLDLHRFYFASPASGSRMVAPDAVAGQWSAQVDSQAAVLAVDVDKGASGLLEIPLQVMGGKGAGAKQFGKKDTSAGVSGGDGAEKLLREGVLVIGVQPADGHKFTFRAGDRKVQKVAVAGQFNGWNPDSHPMVPAGNGVYELFVRLPAGSHPYKFIVDGEWMLDPANPEKVEDGGNANSVVRVGGGDRGRAPVVFARSQESGALVFTVVPGGSGVKQVSTVLQLPDGNSRVVGHELLGNKIRVETEDAPAGSWVRAVVADASGNISNAARAPVKPLSGFQWQDGIIYYAFTDRFANGDESNDRPVKDDRVLPQANYQGGDFQGIRKKIDEGYFRDLGVNVLWLAPLNRNPDGAWQEYLPPYRFYTGYHGYWPVSHKEVEPRFGGEEGLMEMIGAAHGNQMFIIADLVLKHVHVDHPMWKEHKELFGSIDLPDGTKNLRRWDDHQFTTWFEEWLPGFDFDNPEAVKFLIGNAVDFATRFKLDGYRLDAVKHIKRSFWWRYRTAMRLAVDPGRKVPLYSVGETFMDREGIMSFVGPNMLDGQFDFPLYDTIIDVFAKQQAGLEELEKSLAASELVYGKETLMSPLVGNHDKSRFMAYADGDLPDPEEPDDEELGWTKPPKVDNPASYEKLKLALTFVLSIDGVPMVYYGDEIGMTGAGDPDNRRMMRWGGDVTEAEEGVRTHFRDVAAIRHKHPALRYGSRRSLLAEGDRFAFVRAHLGDTVLAVWNRGGSQTEFTLAVGPEMPDGKYADALSGEEIEVKDGKVSFKMPAMKSALFVAKES